MSDVEFGIGLRQIDNALADAKTAEALGYFFAVHENREHVIQMSTDYLSAQYQQDS